VTNPPASGADPTGWRPRATGADPTNRPGRPAVDPAQQWDEQVWRRPPADQPGPTPPSSSPPAYTGPPRGQPADASWRLPTVIQVPPARKLPPQDDVVIDVQEQQARTVTYGVGMIAGAIALIVLFILCGRTFF
jgi:hypothetical protein